MSVLGVVLAGGRSSRFGADKALADWRGMTLADHAAGVLGPHVHAVVRAGGLDGLSDLPRPGLGPLGGIAAALDYAATHGYAGVLTIACDMPEVPSSVLAALLRRAPAYCTGAPVLGHWPAACGAHLLGWLETSADRSVLGWAHAIGALPIVADRPIANVNTREDLLAL